jgi:hypothetical protein
MEYIGGTVMNIAIRMLLVSTILYTVEASGANLYDNSDDRLVAPIRRDLEEKETIWQAGIHGLCGFSSDDTDARYGFGLMLENDFLKPVIFQTNIGLCFSRLKAIFPGQKFWSFSGELDVLYRLDGDKIKPYFGGGIGVISNRYPTGELATGYIDSYGGIAPRKELDFGTRFGFHLTLGTIYQVSDKLGLALDFKRLPSRISSPVLVTSFPSGTTTKETRDYRMSAYTIRLGIIARIYK